ncbi:hypothetical protein EMMF5_001123 [Cystobasidiomycetes sp. EMM_F5]
MSTHLPSLRFFALHAIVDTILCGLVAILFALTAFSANTLVSSQLGHAFCEHVSKGHSFLGFVTSPGSGMENCEEKWLYGIAPIIMLCASGAFCIRAKTARAVWDYYQRALTEGKISLDSPSTSSVSSSTFSHSSSSTLHVDNLGQAANYPYSRASRSRKKRSGTGSSSGSSNGTGGRTISHSRSSSTSTVRPFLAAGTASRIMLLPSDYANPGYPIEKSSGQASSPISPRSGKSSSSESFDTIRGPHPLHPQGLSAHTTLSSSNTYPAPPIPSLSHHQSQYQQAAASHFTPNPSTSPPALETHLAPAHSRKRSMSYDSGSTPHPKVVVYAPILMSIEEAQSLGGREALIGNAQAKAQAKAQAQANKAQVYAQASGSATALSSARYRNTSPAQGQSSSSKDALHHSVYTTYSPQPYMSIAQPHVPPRKHHSEDRPRSSTMYSPSITPLQQYHQSHATHHQSSALRSFRDESATEMSTMTSHKYQ